MMKEHDKLITIFITGSDTTGKTILMGNLKGWKFCKDYYPTIGFDDYKKVFLYKKYLFHLIVSDVGGEYKMPIIAQTCKKIIIYFSFFLIIMTEEHLTLQNYYLIKE